MLRWPIQGQGPDLDLDDDDPLFALDALQKQRDDARKDIWLVSSYMTCLLGNADSQDDNDDNLKDFCGDADWDQPDDLEDLLLEELVTAVAPNEQQPPAAAAPVVDPARKSRVGNTLYVAGRPVGAISYLFHWEPASYSAKCRIHERCVCTGHFAKVEESDMEEWLYKAQRYMTAEEHLQAKPAGAYNKRRRD